MPLALTGLNGIDLLIILGTLLYVFVLGGEVCARLFSPAGGSPNS